jgi:hypothetical protein
MVVVMVYGSHVLLVILAFISFDSPTTEKKETEGKEQGPFCRVSSFLDNGFLSEEGNTTRRATTGREGCDHSHHHDFGHDCDFLSFLTTLSLSLVGNRAQTARNREQQDALIMRGSRVPRHLYFMISDLLLSSFWERQEILARYSDFVMSPVQLEDVFVVTLFLRYTTFELTYSLEIFTWR